MSSASSGRYQSRLFNFVHQQSRRLTKECVRAFQHLQFATSSVAAVVLYPIYLLFQSTESAGKQLHQSVQQRLPKLPANDIDCQSQTPPTADTPIQRVLLAVDLLGEEADLTSLSSRTEPANLLAFLTFWRFKFFPNSRKRTSNLSLLEISNGELEVSQRVPYFAGLTSHNRPLIRGIATQLSNRNLVLVTAQNEVLDILNAQEQQKLQERIIGEVADYWRYQRLAHSANVFPESSLLERGRRQKAELILHPNPTEKQATSFLHPYQALAFLDRTVAHLESKHLASLSELAITVSKGSWELVQQVQSQLIVYFSGNLQSVASNLPARARLDEVLTLNSSETLKLRLQTLIFAAIDYFFGSRDRKRVIATPSTVESRLQAKPLPDRRSAYQLPSAAKLSSLDIEPWLALSDLFGQPDAESEPANFHNPKSTYPSDNPNLALPFSKPAWDSLQNLINHFQTFLPQSKQATTKGLGVKSYKERTSKENRFFPTTGKPVAAEFCSVNSGEIINHSHSQKTQIEPKPDWIETDATAIGYVKHPLEQLLAWLDHAMLWLEELLMKVLQQLQRLWRGK